MLREDSAHIGLSMNLKYFSVLSNPVPSEGMERTDVILELCWQEVATFIKIP